MSCFQENQTTRNVNLPPTQNHDYTAQQRAVSSMMLHPPK